MAMVRISTAAQSELDRLGKRYRSLERSFGIFCSVLRQGQDPPGEVYSGLGLVRNENPAVIRKCRVPVAELGGKRSGLRVVYERSDQPADGAVTMHILAIYVHADDVPESEVRRRILNRFAPTLRELHDQSEVHYE